jgi:enamine deaminase RidA (YjgF/YER057c/UK114 family)
MAKITRIGSSERWADVVIHANVARWVEVASDPQADCEGQLKQIFHQIEETLQQIGSSRNDLLQVTVYLASLTDVAILNLLWDAWVPRGHAPVRACVQACLQGNYQAEFMITAATG